MKYAFIGVCTLFCMMTLLWAQPAKIQPTAAADPAAAKAAVVEDRGVEKVLAGVIVSVDPAKKSITIKVKSGDYPVSITPATTITAKNTALTAADLKPGDYVSVNYRRFNNGDRKAERIENRTYIAKPALQEQKAQKAEIKTQPNTPPQTEVKTITPAQQKNAQQTEVKVQPVTQPNAVQPVETKTQPAAQQKPAENKATEAAK